MPFALFDCKHQISEAFPNEEDVWKHALESALIDDIPVADEAGGQLLPLGYQNSERDQNGGEIAIVALPRARDARHAQILNAPAQTVL
jgi:hypothetical protein